MFYGNRWKPDTIKAWAGFKVNAHLESLILISSFADLRVLHGFLLYFTPQNLQGWNDWPTLYAYLVNVARL